MRLYRQARPASRRALVLTTLAQTAVFWTVFLLLLPWALRALERALGVPDLPPLRLAGGLLFALCSALGLWSGATMAWLGAGTPLPMAHARHLVVRGPYRCVRNPMAIAGIGQGMAVGLWLGSPVVLGYALAGAVLWHTTARRSEERDLLARFGDDYARYRATTPLWLPWPRRHAAAANGTAR